jgi:hypothetical protein
MLNPEMIKNWLLELEPFEVSIERFFASQREAIPPL